MIMDNNNCRMNKDVKTDENKIKNRLRIFQDISNTIHKRTVSLTDLVKTKRDEKPQQKCESVAMNIIEVNIKSTPFGHTDEVRELNAKLDRSGDVLERNSHGQRIIDYLKKRDNDCYLRKGIKGWQNSEARNVLVDWLIKVATYRKTCQRTIHLAIILLDRCIFINPMDLERLQLLGTTCYLLACKYEEIVSPSLSRLVILTEKSFDKQNFIDMEMYILTTLDYDLGYPTPIPFLNRFLMVHDHSLKLIYMARYIVDLLIYSKSSVKYSSALKASSSLYMARSILINIGEYPDVDTINETLPSWTNDLKNISSYHIKDMKPLCETISKLLIKSESTDYNAIRLHYCSAKYFKVSLLPEMNDCKFLKEQLHSIII